MPVDRRLLDILRCPVTKQQVFPLTEKQLTTINQAISAGNVVHADVMMDAEVGRTDLGDLLTSTFGAMCCMQM